MFATKMENIETKQKITELKVDESQNNNESIKEDRQYNKKLIGVISNLIQEESKERIIGSETARDAVDPVSEQDGSPFDEQVSQAGSFTNLSSSCHPSVSHSNKSLQLPHGSNRNSSCSSTSTTKDVMLKTELSLAFEGTDIDDVREYLADPENELLSEYIHEETREYVPGCFEGPEKTLEICFTNKDKRHLPIGYTENEGCRKLTRAQLDIICKQAKCTILNKISNAYLDAYVLSESSLFVYAHRIMIKTCGTTTLLRCLPILLHYCKKLGLTMEWVGYSRKNYSFPTDQFFPHSSFDQETEYLKSHAKLSNKLNGNGYIFGPMTGDHWYLYLADKCKRPSHEYQDRILNIMMFDMDPAVADLFVKGNGRYDHCRAKIFDTTKNVEGNENHDVEKYVGENREDENEESEFYSERISQLIAREMTCQSGIRDLCPGAIIDDYAFEPCGYSMNAIAYGNYSTVHVTPEEACSYASFETNTPLRSYASLLSNALNIFRPKRFVLTMMADEEALKTMTSSPFDNYDYHIPGYARYNRSHSTSTTLETDFKVFMGNFTMDESSFNFYRQVKSSKSHGQQQFWEDDDAKTCTYSSDNDNESDGDSLCLSGVSGRSNSTSTTPSPSLSPYYEPHETQLSEGMTLPSRSTDFAKNLNLVSKQRKDHRDSSTAYRRSRSQSLFF